MNKRILDALEVVVQDMPDGPMGDQLEQLLEEEPDLESVNHLLLTAEFAFEHYLVRYAESGNIDAATKAALGALATLFMTIGKQIGIESATKFTEGIDLSSLEGE